MERESLPCTGEEVALDTWWYVWWLICDDVGNVFDRYQHEIRERCLKHIISKAEDGNEELTWMTIVLPSGDHLAAMLSPCSTRDDDDLAKCARGVDGWRRGSETRNFEWVLNALGHARR